jgi:hypothetical protein
MPNRERDRQSSASIASKQVNTGSLLGVRQEWGGSDYLLLVCDALSVDTRESEQSAPW